MNLFFYLFSFLKLYFPLHKDNKYTILLVTKKDTMNFTNVLEYCTPIKEIK